MLTRKGSRADRGGTGTRSATRRPAERRGAEAATRTAELGQGCHAGAVRPRSAGCGVPGGSVAARVRRSSPGRTGEPARRPA
jgi:hypothetical protein